MRAPSDLITDLSNSVSSLLLRFKVLLLVVLLVSGGTAWLWSLHHREPAWEVGGEIGKFVALVLAIHLMDHEFVKKEERLLFLENLREVVHSEDPQSGRAIFYKGREELYRAIVEVIRRVNKEQPGLKQLRIAGLHGGTEGRRATLLHENAILDRFDRAVQNCAASSGPDRWRVHELYNIVEEDRLNVIEDRIKHAGQAEEYEVRSYSIRQPFHLFRPLVIGKEDLFLLVDDQTYYRSRAGLHVRGTEFVALAMEQYEKMWADKRLFYLRTSTGENSDDLKRLREKILESESD